MSLIGLGLRTPRRIAVLAGIPVVAAISVEETYQSANPASTVLAVIFASSLLFMTAAFAAASLDHRQHAEAMLAKAAATSQARQRAAALAERSRLARDLHDVLAHNLSALAVQLEATRLTAISMGAGEKIVDQVASARKLACIGMLESRRALQLLREGETPDAASLPGLISETSAMLGIPVTLQSHGVQCQLGDGAGLALYRVVQEALTNVAKHAGCGAEVTVRIAWAQDGVEASITDCGGDGVGAGLHRGLEVPGDLEGVGARELLDYQQQAGEAVGDRVADQRLVVHDHAGHVAQPLHGLAVALDGYRRQLGRGCYGGHVLHRDALASRLEEAAGTWGRGLHERKRRDPQRVPGGLDYLRQRHVAGGQLSQ